MMTTCRLLCALLVLALCCCSSVCSTTGDEDRIVHGSDTSPGEPKGAVIPDTANISTSSSLRGQINSLAVSNGKAGASPGEGPGPDPPEHLGEGPITKQGEDGAGGSGGSGSSSGPAKSSAKEGKGEDGVLKGIVGEADPQGILVTAPATTEHPNTGSQAPIKNENPVDTSTQEAQSGSSAATGRTYTNIDNSTETSTTATTNTTTTTTTTTTTAPE
ncbi:mucin TcMUCII, putative, partial [Trypanosoma cruzi marinkellei]